MRARIVTGDQYKDNGIVSEEEAYWPTHHVNVLCGQRTGAVNLSPLWAICPPLAGFDTDYDAQDALNVPLEPDSLVIATEGSKICL